MLHIFLKVDVDKGLGKKQGRIDGGTNKDWLFLQL